MMKNNWNHIGMKKRAGVLVPLFSVYSKDSTGIGDFGDLKLLADWCAESGNSILELLPMNEFGSTFCPYDAVSSFALEPAYIALGSLPGDGRKLVTRKIAELKDAFPAGKGHVDYRIKTEKLRVLREVYLAENGCDSKNFKKFAKENSCWLDDFALFKVLKERNYGRPWYEWEDRYRYREKKALDAFAKNDQEEISFQKWVQWVAAEQLRRAKVHAGSRGVLIKGDLPILISRDSTDVWACPEFFKLDFAAGAPPDMYCAKGQRWGMPTHNWDAIAQDGYRYLKEKLRYAENFYDILRIDHVVGLFRIWSIPYNDPKENEGLNGVFDPADEKVWEAHGKALLSKMTESTKMLLCAEDLGMIPGSCPATLKALGIPGNEVQRWTKDWAVKHDFLPPKSYRKLAVTMLSTHDTTNWAAWWENEAGTVDEALFIRKCAERGINYKFIKAQLFDPVRSRHGRLRWLTIVSSDEVLINILGKRKEELKDFIEMYDNTYKEKEKLWPHLGFKSPMKEESDETIVAAALGITLKSNSVFAINLVTDYLYLADIFKGDPYKYRINFPGTVSNDNWSMTVPLSFEALAGHKITKKIRSMISDAGRLYEG